MLASNLAAMRTQLLAIVLVLSACSFSGEISIGARPDDAAEGLIEEVLADQIGLGELVASCNEPASEEVGSRFLCSAETSDGRTIEMRAVIEEDDSAFVRTTNVVLAENLDEITATIEREVERMAGVELPPGALDCGTETLIVDSLDQVVCPLTDPVGDVFETIITFHGLDTDNTTFDFEVITDR